ncbi:carbohydrate kinase [Bailinhaonella thermotolerans]|uniref:Carbohydrate kinase n=2 Tax=Bailinhaonella thermotolerans TaxID=1070861 RepID=A0A3A4B7P0_9ACTN|nr:carbohydrate kinase [Bailinhaonella thermotolerans]
MAAICVDAGTTMIKAVGYDDHGRESAIARRPAGVDRPRAGWAEQDMDAVWETAAECVREVAARLGAVEFLAVTAQGDGCWLVDAEGAPTGPAILWNDGRAADVVDAWAAGGVLTEAARLTGSPVFAGLPCAILAWLRDRDPGRLERSAAALTCGGWLFARLTGRIAIDPSDASVPFADPATGEYSPALLSLYGLEWARRLLPEPLPDDGRAAPLTPRAAARLGLRPGLPVVLAPYDVPATAIGTGATEPGRACVVLGTTICTAVVMDPAVPVGAPTGFTVALGPPGRLLRVFPTLAGTEVIDWACRLLSLGGPAELGDLAASCPAGAGGLVFLPYLSPSGERAPFLDPDARGALVGLTLDHGPPHVARAVLEGLTLTIRDCLEASPVRPSDLRLCGGGSSSPLWRRLIAAVAALPVLGSPDAEAGARGAHLTGLRALGLDPPRAAVPEEPPPGEPGEPGGVSEWARIAPPPAPDVPGGVAVHELERPDPALVARYDALYRRFLQVRRAVSETWG